ncbi:TonB-dependent hemoglobin/transferrin/lactoferrin family receptor [Congregibacter litoralis]|uniref:TonB-dependent heme/hemoglobin receptor family protein n=1 Tax=Congregibacter litoralis KT71 TaxID=314285 RepID=A4A517_9GAMM|nr:TonB-dependent hemoglobin/transferrin/lactoferrin family receptor [Congregibacter litoralis]EAQ98888.1 TonB-dependent heme/hemoglobin receptor family protein [Congregibacter litoralis KT71]
MLSTGTFSHDTSHATVHSRLKANNPATHLLPRCIAVAVALASSAAALATDSGEATAKEDREAGLEVVTVTATRLDSNLDDVARSIATLNRMDIESFQAQSVAQTLLYEPNISVAGGPRAANQALNIRGLTGNKVLQTVDGARQSFESGHRPGYFLDPELLASVEAVRGPVSSLWGSGALGGVVAQRTLRADDFLAEEQSMGGFLKSGYNSNNSQQTTTAALLGRQGGSDWLLSGYVRDSDDVTLGNGERLEGSAADTRGVLAKFRQSLGDNHSLELIYRGAEFDGAVPSNGTAPINASSNFLLQREQETHNGSLEYRYSHPSDMLDTQVLLYTNRVSMDERRLSDGRDDNTELNTVGINLSTRATIGGAELLFGIDAYEESFDARRSGLNRPEPPQADTEVWSAYSMAQVPLGQSWRLDLGVRYDDFQTRADNLNSERSDDALSPSAALRFSPSDSLSITLRHDRAFRAPSAEELYSSGTHFCMGPGFCNSFTPNPDLDAETAANTELLATLELPGFRSGHRLNLSASVFENKVDDFIEQIVRGPSFMGRPDPGNTSWVNVDAATLRGGEISASYAANNLQLRLGFGSTRGSDDVTGEDLSNIPADTFNADLRYQFTRQDILTGLRFIHAREQSRIDVPELDPNTQFDAYSVVDLYAHWRPQGFDALRIDFNVNNLGDRFYQRAWDQLPQAGREVIISAVYSF